MKKSIRFLALGAALLSLSAFASRTQAQDQCTPENKAAWYNTFLENYKGDQAKAYEVAKKYLACPVDANDANDAAQATYLKDKFVTPYEKAQRKTQFAAAVARKDYAAAGEALKAVLADDPNYIRGYGDLVLAIAVSQDQSLSNVGLNYAKSALALIDSGAPITNWAPFDNKDDAEGKLYYAIASFKLASAPNEAISAFLKAATYNGKIKSSPYTYSGLAQAYELGPYAKQSADYKACCEGKDETDQSKLAILNINQTVDRMIDAYARAVALAGTDPGKAGWMSSLTTWYKYRNADSDKGLNDMVASILSKPLPPEPAPITSLPPATPASGSSASGVTTTAAKNTTTVPPKTTPATRTSGPTKPKRAHAPNL